MSKLSLYKLLIAITLFIFMILCAVLITNTVVSILSTAILLIIFSIYIIIAYKG